MGPDSYFLASGPSLFHNFQNLRLSFILHECCNYIAMLFAMRNVRLMSVLLVILFLCLTMIIFMNILSFNPQNIALSIVKLDIKHSTHWANELHVRENRVIASDVFVTIYTASHIRLTFIILPNAGCIFWKSFIFKFSDKFAIKLSFYHHTLTICSYTSLW